MKRMVICTITIIIFAITGCKNKTIEATEENVTSIKDGVTDKTSEEDSIQGHIEKMKYLDRDSAFLLELNNGENTVVSKEGKTIDSSNLNSAYLQTTGEQTSSEKDILDLFGESVQDRFIKDYEHEKIIGVCRMDTQDVVWVLESQETPSVSEIIVKAFNESGNELCRISSSDSNINEKTAKDFKDITTVEYSGDTTCRILYTKANTQGLFCVNIETGEILDENANYSDGYAISGGYVKDLHGNIVADLSDNNFSEVAQNSEGLFFSKTSKKFYDIHLNEMIDLNNYDLMFWNGNIGDGGWKEQYVFKDGYCGIEVQNENGTQFYGVIDTEGNWIVELTDTLSAQWDRYYGKISDTKIRLGSKLYDIDAQQMQDIPPSINDNNSAVCDKNYYYVDETGKFLKYNPETEKTEEINLQK